MQQFNARNGGSLGENVTDDNLLNKLRRLSRRIAGQWEEVKDGEQKDCSKKVTGRGEQWNNSCVGIFSGVPHEMNQKARQDEQNQNLTEIGECEMTGRLLDWQQSLTWMVQTRI